MRESAVHHATEPMSARSTACQLACGVLLWTVAAGTRAQQPESAEYRELVAQALDEYQRGNFSEAKVYFSQAHALSPSARTMRGLGLSAYEMRDYVDAIGWFERALEATVRPLTGTMREEATRLLDRSGTFVSRLRVYVSPDNAVIRIDSQPVQKDADGMVLLGPGTHELVAEAPDHEPLTRSVRTVSGERIRLDLALSPRETGEKTPELALADSEPQTEESAAQRVDDDGSSRAGPWIVIAASGTVAVTGAVLLAVALDAKDTVEHPTGDTPQYDQAADERVLPMSTAGIAALAIGGAGLIGGFVWLLTSAGEPERAANSPHFELTPSGVRVRGRF